MNARAQENGWAVRELPPDELDQAARLRHRFFVQQKGWVSVNPSDPERELDRYDPHAVHLGVFDGDELIAYMRAVPGRAPTGFMLDTDFRECLTGAEFSKIVHETGVELSRRVAAEHLDLTQAREAVGLLFRGFHLICLAHGFTHIYIVQEPSYNLMLRRWYGLRFTALNKTPYRFPDGTEVNVEVAETASLKRELQAKGQWKAYADIESRFEEILIRR